MSELELARLYRQEGDDVMRDYRRRDEHLHTDALPAAAKRWYARALCVLLYAAKEDRHDLTHRSAPRDHRD